ncbi:Asp23/Gls24 family envelope stress response protein [Goodfellowiella coeruleoviolacea]|uniref:Conserved protein YloU, alkaline shock protein (Asp23) family n=1 Tax=Goodfellowiella coeruleoviolacea TaxID=334858 RepID=A0AAE3KF38_9PSEU|nr:Asp23/Gls24 family envelope stress response protein [Goodfellowiella coeruleoviolacea]MCP2164542.1 putative conserved protein YloU, alkaline shock protein (Asp23) family [Goodfellowiella coeruleoviolacea]
MTLPSAHRTALITTATVEVGEGVLVDTRAVARLAAIAAREVRGVLGLAPSPGGLVTSAGRRLREPTAGRGAGEPADGVRVALAQPGSVVVDVALSVGGRPARDVATDVARHIRQTLERQLGVRTRSVRVNVVDIALSPVRGVPLSDTGW